MPKYEPVTDRDERDAHDFIAKHWHEEDQRVMLRELAQLIANGRRESMENRERDLRRKVSDAQREFHERVQPWIKELSEIGLCKPPEPVTLPDGRIATYVGPLPTWEPDGLKMRNDKRTER